jgi:hypothetical protein
MGAIPAGNKAGRTGKIIFPTGNPTFPSGIKAIPAEQIAIQETRGFQ